MVEKVEMLGRYGLKQDMVVSGMVFVMETAGIVFEWIYQGGLQVHRPGFIA